MEKYLQSGKDKVFSLTVDSSKQDEWFVVLQGARDGHDFLPMAQQKECAGAIGQRMPENWTGGFIRVNDSLLAFQQIAHGFDSSSMVRLLASPAALENNDIRAMIAAFLKV